MRRVVAAIGMLALLSACAVPVTNAPAGGGDTVTATYRIGPFALAADGSLGSDDESVMVGIGRPEGTFGIKSMRFDLVDAAGASVSRHDVHLHHVVLTDLSKDPLCPNAARPLVFAAAGAERTEIALPDPYALLVGETTTWAAAWHLMNTSASAKTVYIEYSIDYQPDATAANSRGVAPYFLDVDGCGDAEFDVPGTGGTGSIHLAKRTWTAPASGIVVFAGGHLHEGGIDLRASQKGFLPACTTPAHYSDEHDHHAAPGDPYGYMIESIGTCELHHAVNAGVQYVVEARYDNSVPRHGVMGIAMAYVWHGVQ